MTNFADAMKEIAIAKASSFKPWISRRLIQSTRRYEKAVDFDDAGSVTILAVTMPGDDITSRTR